MNTRELSIEAPRAAVSTITVSAVSAQSAALEPGDYAFLCSVGCHILFGSNPTATTSCARVPADTMLRIANVSGGEKLAVIADGAGTAYFWKD